MNYEELYTNLQPAEKKLKDASNQAVRYYKAVVKNTESGDLSELKKSLQALSEAAAAQQEAIAELTAFMDSFDVKEYIVSGDFTRQMLENCAAENVNVRGENGVYEMFPFKVRVVGDENHAELWLNRKKLPSFRPKAVVQTVKTAQEKLNRANFNATAFADELSEAYDTAILKSGARPGTSQALTKIHKVLTPMSRARKEYDLQAFAYDVARLYNLGTDAWITKSGRRFNFGTGREGSGSIRVLNVAGVETFVNTLSFYTSES